MSVHTNLNTTSGDVLLSSRLNQAVSVNSDGHVGLGTLVTSNYTLQVSGTVRSHRFFGGVDNTSSFTFQGTGDSYFDALAVGVSVTSDYVANFGGTIRANSYSNLGIAAGSADRDQVALDRMLTQVKGTTGNYFVGPVGGKSTWTDRFDTSSGYDTDNSSNMFYSAGNKNLRNDGIGGFLPILYAGTGASNSITGLGFQPDFVWIKDRDTAVSHYIFDKIRGATKVIYSDRTDVETTAATSLVSFDADGFSLGTNSDINGSGKACVAWCFECPTHKTTWAGAGTDPADEYINENTGMSIVKFAGGVASVNHNLAAAPALMITKRVDGAAQLWQVYHHSCGDNPGEPGDNPEDYFLSLDDTAAQTNAPNSWNDTAPTNELFFLGSNFSGDNYIAYLFAEVAGFSKFGTYEGTGASNAITGLGFEPEFLIIKNIDSTDNWKLLDNTRGDGKYLEANTTDVEATDTTFATFQSDGFTVNNAETNNSGDTYVYMAFGSRGAALDYIYTSRGSKDQADISSAPTSVIVDVTLEEIDSQTLNTDILLYTSRVSSAGTETVGSTDVWQLGSFDTVSVINNSGFSHIKGTVDVSGLTDSAGNTDMRARIVGANTKTTGLHSINLDWS